MHQLTLDITSHIMGAPRMGSAAVSAASSSSSPMGSAAVSAASSPTPGAPRFCAAASSHMGSAAVSAASSTPHAKGRAHCWHLLAIMQDGTWRTPYELHELTGIGLLSITARLRNLREPQYGACQLNVRQRQGAPNQTYEYQIIPPMGTPPGVPSALSAFGGFRAASSSPIGSTAPLVSPFEGACPPLAGYPKAGGCSPRP